MDFDLDVAVIGGCGRAGLPLGLAFADRGLSVALHDIDEEAISVVAGGAMPFREAGAEEILTRALADGGLSVTSDPAVIRRAENLVVAIGTPVDEHLNPDLRSVSAAFEGLLDHFVSGQLLVLRSTVYPGMTAFIENLLREHGLDIDVSFCPERIVEGRALEELAELPQIISGRTVRATERAQKLFANLTSELVELTPEEAELAKLFTNSWRYAKFAIANQFFMIANDYGLDFERIRRALTQGYPRAADMPGAGFAAGPCLFKDTAQLAAFNNNDFILGQASMMINEGLPLYLVSRLERRFDLSRMTVGILGMAFKAESDDTRSSLSYKLKGILRFKAKAVLSTDPYVTVDPDVQPLDEVVSRADLLIVAAPHQAYAELETDVPIVDIWNVVGSGVKL